MKVLEVEGNVPLLGSVEISGAKNSAVALIPASILCDEEVNLNNVPNISDVDALESILIHLNAEVRRTGESISVNCKNVINNKITEDMSVKLRASYYFMGALLSKFKKVDMYFPGGCSIGSRPINLHLDGFKLMGANIMEDGNHFIMEAPILHGANIDLNFPSVGATINLMLAASKADGETIINNAAKEPEIVNVATFLNNMGAKIRGAGTSTIKIDGVSYLHKCFHEVIPDRIEAGTYAIIGALTGKKLKICGIIEEHLEALLSKLKEMGVKLKVEDNNIIISKSRSYKPINVKTLVFPGFVTDLGQPMSVLLTQANGMSIFEETIYENRMGHVKYLQKLGADIKVSDRTAIITGPTPFIGTEVVATDLRAGAAMVIAGLIAKGTTTIESAEHILRGYENIVEKLTAVGADIKIEEVE